MSGIKGSKRAAAKLLREAAKAIETFGWTQGRYGNTEVGFCALGAMLQAGGKSASFRLAESAIASMVGGGIVGFNDYRAHEAKEVTGAMRKAARALEHGLKVTNG